jgi:hypothetical protein
MLQSSIEFPCVGNVTSSHNPKTLTDSLFKGNTFDSLVGKNERECTRLTKVRVYRNLNKPEFYSIMAMTGVNKGKVVGYARSVLLENCHLVISEASRQRVLRDKRKNVHAFCQGYICDASNAVQALTGNECAITYNPYRMGSFFRRDDGVPYTGGCTQVLLQGSDAYVLEHAK